MKIAMQFAAAMAFAALQWCATAATIEVGTVAELTNAVARVNAGEKIGGEAIDTIRLKKGTYTFADEAMSDNGLISVGAVSLTIEGEDDSPRNTWTEGSEPVIVDGNGLGRILYFPNSSKNWIVRNICFTRGNHDQGGAIRCMKASGATVTNCVFRQNSGTTGAAAMWVVLRDCLVEGSTGTAVRGGGVSERQYAYGCDFVRNTKGIATYGFVAQDCSFVCNTNSGSSAIGDSVIATNCTFTGNKGAYLATGASFHGCVFSNNYCTGGAPQNPGGILYNPVEVRGCSFIDNYSEQAACAIFHKKDALMTVADCTFLRNVSEGGGYGYSAGAAILSQPTTVSCTMTVTNCTFEGNVSLNNNGICGAIGVGVFANPARQTERQMWELATVIDSTFKTNFAKTAAGVHSVRAINCVFDGNMRSDGSQSECDAARKCVFEGCDFNTANFTACAFDRCRIHDATNNAVALFRGYTRVTNSIIENCKLYNAASMYHYSSAFPEMDAEFVNCTIVSNVMRTYNPSASFSPLVGIKFKNCLLYGNHTGYSWYDISANDESDQHSYLTFENTYVGIITNQWGGAYNMTAADITRFTTEPNSLRECKDPKFVGMNEKSRARYPDAPFWVLSPLSPLRGKGDPLDFTESDLDLAGRPRLDQGYIDPGCYQCWLKPLGFTLMFR